MRAPGHAYFRGDPGSSRSEDHQKTGLIWGVMSTYPFVESLLRVHSPFTKHQNIKVMEIECLIESNGMKK